ncbi:MAG: hypothetical protein JNK82_25985 [Myxococcaceae bacterium]|nr:hypothetical protein [Myxococcaceae bacterium]
MSLRRGAVVELKSAAQQVENSSERVPEELAASPLYGVAMLKIAMELKKADAKPVDELITGVLKRMNLPEADFRTFLSMNGGLLKTIAQKRRY